VPNPVGRWHKCDHKYAPAGKLGEKYEVKRGNSAPILGKEALFAIGYVFDGKPLDYLPDVVGL
jgi:hypothetical protein